MSDQQAESRFATDGVPLYYQLSSILREEILSGRYGPGDQMPTEAELVADYSVSRITVRQALKSLEEQGIIRREAGRGTFVTGDLPQPKALRMFGSLDDLISMGMATRVELLDLREVKATRQDVEELEVEARSPIVQCTRLRFYHAEPYSYIVNRLPKAMADRFEGFDWEKGSILQFVEAKLGLRLRDAEQTVQATLADATLARLLGTRIGAPLLSVDRVVRTDTGEPVERVHTFYRGDLYSLTVNLTRDPRESRHADDWTLRDSAEGE